MITTAYRDEVLRQITQAWVNYAPNVPSARALGGLWEWSRSHGIDLSTLITEEKLTVNVTITI